VPDAVIRVQRSSAYAARFRRLRVLTDGVRAARIKAGETVEIPVERGMHKVRVKVDWYGSREVEVAVPPDASLACRPRDRLWSSLSLAWIKPSRWLVLEAPDAPEERPSRLLYAGGAAIVLVGYSVCCFGVIWLIAR
jgi:hypothetical protein